MFYKEQLLNLQKKPIYIGVKIDFVYMRKPFKFLFQNYFVDHF